MGLREMKKARTRKMISDLATRLFMERSFADVTVAEIAEKASVSIPTVFNYFPTKESLVFDEDEEREAKLIDAVVSRKAGMPILDALRVHLLDTHASTPECLEGFKSFKKLIESTTELSEYARRMWSRYEQSLAITIQQESKKNISKLEAEALAHFVLDSFHRALQSPDPNAAINLIFGILEHGWKE